MGIDSDELCQLVIKEEKLMRTSTTTADPTAVTIPEDPRIESLRERGKRRWKRELLLYAVIFIPTTLLAIFIPPALPIVLLVAVILTAINYSLHSPNWKLTVGRGVAAVISLLTAMLTMVMVMSLGFSPFFIAIAGIGPLVANLVLYRNDVPDVIKELAGGVSKAATSLRQIIHQAYLSFMGYQPVLTNEDKPAEDSKKDDNPISTFEKRLRMWLHFITIPAALIAGYILTAGMWSTWGRGISFFSHLPAFGFTASMASPYVIIPLLIIAFVANSAFMHRGVSQVVSFAINLFKAWRYGLYLKETKDNTEEYELINSAAYTKTVACTGFAALARYYFNIKKDDSQISTVLKITVLSLVKLAIAALIVFISQKALIDVYMKPTPLMVSFLQGMMVASVLGLFTYIGYAARMSFSVIRLANVSQLLLLQFPKLRYTLTALRMIANREFLSRYWQSLKENIRTTAKQYTIGPDNAELWKNSLGEKEWQAHWNKECNMRWEKLTRITKVYYDFKAFIVWAKFFIMLPMVLANAFANGEITMTSAKPVMIEILDAALARAIFNGVVSGALMAKATNDQAKALKDLVSGMIEVPAIPVKAASMPAITAATRGASSTPPPGVGDPAEPWVPSADTYKTSSRDAGTPRSSSAATCLCFANEPAAGDGGAPYKLTQRGQPSSMHT